MKSNVLPVLPPSITTTVDASPPSPDTGDVQIAPLPPTSAQPPSLDASEPPSEAPEPPSSDASAPPSWFEAVCGASGEDEHAPAIDVSAPAAIAKPSHRSARTEFLRIK